MPFLFFFFLFFFFFLLVSFVASFVVWWGIFLSTSVCFFFLLNEKCYFGFVLNYFLIQEILGFFFLIFFSFGGSLLVLFLKVGVSPFHFWSLLLSYYLEGFLLVWFLTLQKLPFLPLFFIFIEGGTLLILFGVFLCFLSVFFFSDSNSLVLISSTESFGWLLICSYFFFSFFLFCVVFYILSYFCLFVSSIFSSPYFSFEVSLVLLNFPLSGGFFINLFVFMVLGSNSFFLLLPLLFFFFVSLLGASRLLFVVCMRSNFSNFFLSSFFLFFPFSFAFLF